MKFLSLSVNLSVLGLQRDRVVRAQDLKSGGRGFKSRSDHYLELFLGSPEFNSSASFVNSQMVRLLPAGILNHVILYLKYLFLPICFIVPESPLRERIIKLLLLT